jgi:tetratricopeptide (TPR) repeat protein
MSGRTWHDLGEAYQSLSWYEQAIQSFEQALQWAPQNRETWVKLAQCHALMGKKEKALESLEQATRALPQDADLLFTLGLYYDRYDRRGAFCRVREVYKRLQRLDRGTAQRFYDQFIRQAYTQNTF